MNRRVRTTQLHSDDPGIEFAAACGCAFLLVFQFHRTGVDGGHILVYFRRSNRSSRSLFYPLESSDGTTRARAVANLLTGTHTQETQLGHYGNRDFGSFIWS